MPPSYRAQIGSVLEALAEGLAPFVDRRMRRYYQDEDWIVVAATKMGRREPVLASPTDPQFQLEVMVRWWGPAFAPVLPASARETVQELRQARNDWAHIDESRPIDLSYARRIHALAEDLLHEIDSTTLDRVIQLGEELERTAARDLAEAEGISESEVLIRQLTTLRSEREELAERLREAQEAASTAAGRQRATARQLAGLQAQYAAVAGLSARYRELQERLEEADRSGEDDAHDAGRVRDELAEAERARVQLLEESDRLHRELEEIRRRIETIDPLDTEIGRRWLMLVTVLVMVLGIAILLTYAIGTAD